MAQPIRVLVVDDSAFMRQMISRMLTEAGMEVVGLARNGQEGYALARVLRPDVITLDVQMPVMDGLEMLRRLMREAPMPVVMLSSLTQKDAPETVEALSLGAVDFVPKPGTGSALSLPTVRDELVEKVRVAARARVRRPRRISRTRPRQGERPRRGTAGIVVIGTSTGGPSALTHVLPQIPGDFPLPVVVVQHMPAGFTASLARRLNGLARLRVAEALSGVVPEPGEAWIAKGGTHLLFSPEGAFLFDDGPPHLGVRPAVDVTAESAVKRWGGAVILVVLTGMGTDGVEGARRVKEAGGRVIVQDEASSVVYGMPRAVAENGLADTIASLDDIPAILLEMAETHSMEVT